jgi:hypothetical protein
MKNKLIVQLLDELIAIFLDYFMSDASRVATALSVERNGAIPAGNMRLSLNSPLCTTDAWKRQEKCARERIAV